MKNIIRGLNSKEITEQLNRAKVQKDLLIKNIYKQYEIYFHIVRKSIFESTERGILALFSDITINDKLLNTSELSNFLNENIGLLIHSKLPFITIEQLKLGDISDPKKLIVNANAYNDSLKLKEYRRIDFDYEDEIIANYSPEFHCNNNPNIYKYFEYLSEDQSSSVNLDESDYLHSFSSFEQISIKQIEDEKNIFNSVIELIQEKNDNQLNHYERINDQVSDVLISSENLNFFEIIDKSFSNFLLQLSYKVNSELFKKKLIEKITSEETFKCLSNNNYITKYPHPFIIRYEFNANKYYPDRKVSPYIYLFNITNVELEFYNLDLSICRNNINELKSRFRLLNKKQRYWKNKDLAFNNSN